MTTTLAPAHDALGEGVAPRSEYDSRAERRRAPFRADIQGLRAIAVTLVVLYHCGVQVVGGGFVGVDVFFVISGYLITLSLLAEADRTGTISLSGFYARRIRRLLPSALLVISVTVAVARLWGPAYESTRSAIDGLFAAFYAMNLRLIDEGTSYQQIDRTPTPFQHFWSLAVEEQFYVVWPIVLIIVVLLTRRTAPSVRRAALGLVVTAVIGASLWASVHFTATDSILAYYAPHTRAWELGSGALVAVAQPLLAQVPRVIGAGATWIGVALIGWSATAYTATTPLPRQRRRSAGGRCCPGDRWRHDRVPVGRRSSPSRARRATHRPRDLRLVPLALASADPGPSLLWQGVHPDRKPRDLGDVVVAGHPDLLGGRATRAARAGKSVPVVWCGCGAVSSRAGHLHNGGPLRPTLEGDGPPAAALDLSRSPAQRLSKELDAAVAAAKVPANLTPGLDQAREDEPATTFNGCHLDFLDTAQPPCAFGDTTAKRTIVLFGDSHAQQWFSAVDRLGREDGWRVIAWTKAACPVADVVLTEVNLGRRYTECAQWREARLAAIAKAQPELVIASQADTLAGPTYNDRTWGAATARTVKRLAASAKKVLLLGDTPRPTRDVPACLADNPDDVARCTVTAPRGVPPGSSLGYLIGRSNAATQAAKAAGAEVLTPTPWICDELACPPIVANVLVYRDSSHLTDTYATALTPLLRLNLSLHPKEPS